MSLAVPLPQTVGKSPLKNLAKFSGWTALSSEWKVWAGARVAVLWAAGGVVLPLGVVTTRPVWVEAMGPGSGVVVADPQGKVDPVVLATPAHHPLLTTIAHYLVCIPQVSLSYPTTCDKTLPRLNQINIIFSELR